MTTKQNETPRLIAERLAQNFNYAFRGSYVPSAYRDATTAIEAALNAERERCAKVADTIKESSRTLTAKNTAMTIAVAIRGLDHA